jgi:hypothetical protein
MNAVRLGLAEWAVVSSAARTAMASSAGIPTFLEDASPIYGATIPPRPELGGKTCSRGALHDVPETRACGSRWRAFEIPSRQGTNNVRRT